MIKPDLVMQIYYIIQVEGIKILALGDKVIPGSQKNKLSSENPKIILTPHSNISTLENKYCRTVILLRLELQCM